MKPTVIIPCAGKSTRFNLGKPKWMLTHPSGSLMLFESISGLKCYDNKTIITVVQNDIDKSHIDLNEVLPKNDLKKFHIIDDYTSSQAETVYKTIIENNVIGPIFIKDCDNYFKTDIVPGNFVCFAELDKNINPVNKSYISLNKFGLVSGIVEKQIIGNKFCVGGYSFNDANDFVKSYDDLIKIRGIIKDEIYISHIIQHMLLNGYEFFPQSTSNYIDWGTEEDWNKFTNEFATIFIDLDGVLVNNSSEFFSPKWGETNGLVNNIKKINELYDTGKYTIIITTSRKKNSSFFNPTLNQLHNCGIKYHDIIFNLPHAKRILINDFADTNKYPSAKAISIPRDCDNLDKYLKE